MSELNDRIAQFRKMANDDPENELGHFRLGQLLMEAEQHEAALGSFRRTLELSPQFSKVFQLAAACLIKLDRKPEAIQTLKEGFAVADERGDNMPRDEMAKMLGQLGEAPPAAKPAAASPAGGATGFQCQRPGCMWGLRARKLTAAPMGDAIGQRVLASICAECWNEWVRNYSIKVINELRLDLSTEKGQAEYDRYMNEFFGFE